METATFVEILDREGVLLASAAEAAGVDAKVPTCPGWQVRDLLRHTGMVHRWAAEIVAEGHAGPVPDGGAGDPDCELAGPAVRLYPALWNRLPFPEVTGDASLAALWCEKSGVTWN
ncbi:maleylpyruvate isomerase N-terminal domain-containing protein [Streptomyces sp. NPDC097107]|uniref:maleylpyruvate isomerase N-terminal domain-containing protein n=1 Tax=Streptomyces sp. NPDC097107 TaxID=3366089 RepID=UPI0037F55FB1